MIFRLVKNASRDFPNGYIYDVLQMRESKTSNNNKSYERMSNYERTMQTWRMVHG